MGQLVWLLPGIKSTIHNSKFNSDLSALLVVGGAGINMPVGWRC